VDLLRRDNGRHNSTTSRVTLKVHIGSCLVTLQGI
jgi:hypothetical protein